MDAQDNYHPTLRNYIKDTMIYIFTITALFALIFFQILKLGLKSLGVGRQLIRSLFQFADTVVNLIDII